MIGQYLSNKNKIAIVAKSEFFSELNKALEKEKLLGSVRARPRTHRQRLNFFMCSLLDINKIARS